MPPIVKNDEGLLDYLYQAQVTPLGPSLHSMDYPVVD